MHRTGCTVTILENVHVTENMINIQLTFSELWTCTGLVFIQYVLYIFICTFFFPSQSQIYYADLGEIEVIVKNLQPEDIDEEFMEHNGISKMCGPKCRTELKQLVGNLPAAVKGAFEVFLSLISFISFWLFSVI